MFDCVVHDERPLYTAASMTSRKAVSVMLMTDPNRKRWPKSTHSISRYWYRIYPSSKKNMYLYIIMHAHHCMVSANRRTWPGMRQSVIHVIQVLWRRKELFWRMCQCWVDVCLILAATDQFQWPILSSPRPGNGSDPAHLPIHVFVFFLLFFLEIHQHSIETYCRL